MNLIVGENSLIGSCLSEFWITKKISFHLSTRHKGQENNDKPLINLNNTRFNLHCNYESAIICAGKTNIISCEDKLIESRRINVTGTIALLKKLLEMDTHIVFLSSNAVFDGKNAKQKPNDPRIPNTEYGKQKVEVEKFLETYSNACILRLSKVIHPELKLLQKWRSSLQRKQMVFAFSDMTISPIYINDVVKKIDFLVSQKSSGIYQLSGDHDISYYDFARLYAIDNDFDSELIRKGSWKDKLDIKPPKYTSLVNV